MTELLLEPILALSYVIGVAFIGIITTLAKVFREIRKIERWTK